MSETAKETIERIRKRRADFAKKKVAQSKEKLNSQNIPPDVREAIKQLNKPPQEKTVQVDLDWDYIALCKAYQQRYGGTFVSAMKGVDKRVPDAREKYIEKMNADRDAAKTPVSIEKIEGRNFEEWVRHLRLNRELTTAQAHAWLEREFGPGLQQSYIDRMNT